MADMAIVNAWKGYANARAQQSVQSDSGMQMMNMMTQMATQWMTYKQQVMAEDKKAMDKFVPQEGDIMNVMKDFTPAAQAKMMGTIGEMRGEMFKAMQNKDKPKVAEYWGKINSVTDQLKIVNGTLANHKKNYEEGNYSSASDHFDIAQFTTGKYELMFDPESAQVSLAMFDKEKNPRIYTPDQLGNTSIVKQHDLFEEMEKEVKSKFNEAVTLSDFEFDNGHFENFANRITEKNSNVISLAHDDGYKNGGKNVMHFLQEDETSKRKQSESLGLPHIPNLAPQQKADPWSPQYDGEYLKTKVIGIDGEGKYTEGGLMNYFEEEFNRMSKAYQKKIRVKENKPRTSSTENFTVHTGTRGNLEVTKNVNMHKTQISNLAQKIENGQAVPIYGMTIQPTPGTDVNGYPLWQNPTTGQPMSTSALVNFIDDGQGTFALMNQFQKFSKPKL